MYLRVSLPNSKTISVDADFPFDTSPLGYRVLINNTTGIVTGIATAGERQEVEFPDYKPVTTVQHIEAVRFVAKAYGLIPNLLLFELLPSEFLWRKTTVVSYTGKTPSFLDKKVLEVIEYVRSRGKMEKDKLVEKFGKDIVDKLLRMGFLKEEDLWKAPNLKVKFYSLGVSFEEALRRIGRLRKKEERLTLIAYLKDRVVSSEELSEIGVPRSVLRDLVKRGIVREEVGYVSAIRSQIKLLRQPSVELLRPLGKNSVVYGSLKKLQDMLTSLTHRNLSDERSTFVFCPSLELLSGLEDTLGSLFGERLKVISSKERPKDLVQSWFSLDEPCVLLGSQKSLLAPVKNLGTIVYFGPPDGRMHNGISYLTFLFRYSKLVGADLVVFNSVPNLYLYMAIKDGTFQGMDLSYTAQVFVLKRRGENLIDEGLKRLVDPNKSTLLLVNKAGYAYAYCERCAEICQCPVCGKMLSLSKDGSRVFCASCGYKTSVCPKCDSPVRPLGFGVEKVLEEVQETWKNLKDFDVRAMPSFWKEYEQVLVLNVDNILSVASFEAREKLFSYLFTALSVAKERLIVQTFYPEEVVFQALMKKDPKIFLEEELLERKEENLPPFTRLIVAYYKDTFDERYLIPIRKLVHWMRTVKTGSLKQVYLCVPHRNSPQVLAHVRRYKPIRLYVY
ncbi:hypothetical protein [Thermocrinis minervae]|uniref:Replication restart DNA helicase PriA n=1 Tax=Thermocrinis minervae TaxID=381751 RepID=A0A1M6RTB2_9AQUI|nr:hypothetical protein [Thermocrinis minervae]SHK35683.1 replication restart DNA helicase PriA [Thermocrinis minervae]